MFTPSANIFSLLYFCLLFVAVLSASDELRAVLEFKKGIKHDPLGRVLDSWNKTSVSVTADHYGCPSSFYGVICDEASNSVTAIVLERLQLRGELKFFTLTGLRMLKNLNLAGNYFTGRLVPALGSMSSLQHLDLSDNLFYGPIPKRFNDLYGLIYLNLSSNRFFGWYPSGVRNLQQLRVLDFHSNEISGDVGIFFSELSNVEHVDLSSNMFSGSLPSDPKNVSGLGNTLQHLNLSHNRLNGDFFSNDTMALFRNLKVLDLGAVWCNTRRDTNEFNSFGRTESLRKLLLRFSS
ncbi:hypothetical protein Nepgr_016781 [Nepenthes gracilis]|uniref:Leucine-rich repeat-containing N-terminal plant-type domain-containing protein n=1 Tax=Nepenthes gracilis TaxID=150966 RepID=A0AAD3XST2_NEPGR|nr:hypothetical protein Nepgr_016781 [Nepenthes gracilis]